MPEVSIIIPVYNGSKFIHELVEAIFKALAGFNYQIILVDDFSSDNSWHVVKDFSTRYTQIEGIRLSKNVGQQKALMYGCKYASGTYIVTLDQDLQHDPSYIPAMLNILKNNNLDIVIAKYKKKKHSLWRNLGTWLVKSAIFPSLNLPKSLSLTSYRLFKKSVIENLKKKPQSSHVFGYQLLQVTHLVDNYVIDHKMSSSGQRSTYSTLKLISYFLEMIIRYTTWPLTLGAWIGGLLFVFSFFLGMYFLYLYFSGSIVVSGFTTIVLLISGFSGMILFLVAIIGLYLAKAYESENLNEEVSVENSID